LDEEKLISKKEVLEKLGISYGQLYRWKRKGLIPESWFVRKATFTGQETFFPEKSITARIKRIVEMKDDYPLDQLADLITTRINDKVEVALSKLRRLGWFDDEAMKICHFAPDQSSLSLQETLCVYALRQLVTKARNEEIDLVKTTLDKSMAGGLMDRIGQDKLVLYLLRKRLSAAGISAEISLVSISPANAIFDPETEIVQTLDLQAILQQMKLDLGNQKRFSEDDQQDHTQKKEAHPQKSEEPKEER
jgi:DNA-binding transcriptional MerR regulator